MCRFSMHIVGKTRYKRNLLFAFIIMETGTERKAATLEFFQEKEKCRVVFTLNPDREDSLLSQLISPGCKTKTDAFKYIFNKSRLFKIVDDHEDFSDTFFLKAYLENNPPFNSPDVSVVLFVPTLF